MKVYFKKIIAMMLSGILLLSSISFADEFTEEYNRTVASYTFENEKVGQLPKTLSFYDAATSRVDLHEDKNVLFLDSPYAAAKPSAILMDRDYTGITRIDMRIKYPKVFGETKILIKDLTANVFKNFVELTSKSFKALDQAVTDFSFQPDTWYTVSVTMNSNTKTAAVYIDGQKIKENKAFDVNYNNLSFRLQCKQIDTAIQDTLTVYVDSIHIYLNAYPSIKLKGDETIYYTMGEEYIEPGYTAYDMIDKDITDKVVVSGEIDTQTVGTYTLKYDVTTSDGTMAEPKYRTVIVNKYNWLNNAQISADSSKEGFGISNIADDDYYTSWKAEGTKAVILMEYNKIQVVDEIVVNEIGNNIKSWDIKYSTDGLDWVNLNSAPVSEGQAKKFSFYPIEAKKIMLTVEADEQEPEISELCTYVDNSSIVEVDASKLYFSNSGSVVTSDLVLKNTGTYGSKITWTSSDPNAITGNGMLLSPSYDATVTLTATLNYLSAQKVVTFPGFIVKGKSKKEGSSGKGSSSGGGSVVRSYVTDQAVVKQDPEPTANTDVETKEDFSSVFTDVESTHWAYNNIKALKSKNIMSGTSDGNFEPDRSITREEFLKIILLGLDLDVSEYSTDFEDVEKNAWYYSYVSTGQHLSIINGINNNRFGIGQQVSRQDASVMLVNALKAADINLNLSETLIKFNDEGDISEYAKESVRLLQQSGILSGDENERFLPNSILTRAQAAKIICMAMEARGNK